MLKMQIQLIEKFLNTEIKIEYLREHSKASEKYIDISIKHNNKENKWSIPYYYRRTGLFIDNENDLATYLNDIYPQFSKKNIDLFLSKEKKRWSNELKSKKTTSEFFNRLLNLKWNSVKYDLPPNPNWARRIQDIKELGYTLATDTNRKVKGKKEYNTHIMLLPLKKGGITGYEVMSKEFVKKAIKVLGTKNIYELGKRNKHGLIPDHKFPEIRWDKNTRDVNSKKDINFSFIKKKFQLLDNQRNLQKREICRKCFQTGRRGIIFGIEYFYKGNHKWPENIPKIGKEAEKGCVGCGWYDVEEWRKSLQNIIDKK